MTGERFDLVVIGSGPAGEKGAVQAAYFGKRVAVVEREDAVGGDAAMRAVIPSKTLRETALYLTGFRTREVYGLSLSVDPETTLETLLHRTAEVVATSTQQVRANLERHGVEMIHGRGRLVPGPAVAVETEEGERLLRADIVLIATGSRPHRPADVPFDDPDIEDSEEILELRALPTSLVVVGGGAIGCEYASIFNALGTQVTLVDARDRLIPYLDGEISDLLAETLRADGVRLLTGARVGSIAREDGTVTVRIDGGEVLRPDKVLYAVGRAGQIGGLGLEDAGVKVDERRRIQVDDRFQTSAPGVYAAGDVIGPPSLASVSMEQGRVAVCHAFGIPFKESVDPNPPLGVYTIPEVAMAGLTEEEAGAEGEVEVGRGWFRDNPRARIAGLTDGLVKLVFRPLDRRLLGVHILGDAATEIVHHGQAVLHAEGTIDRFITATFNVPSRSDAYKYAAYDGLQRLAKRG